MNNLDWKRKPDSEGDWYEYGLTLKIEIEEEEVEEHMIYPQIFRAIVKQESTGYIYGFEGLNIDTEINYHYPVLYAIINWFKTPAYEDPVILGNGQKLQLAWIEL